MSDLNPPGEPMLAHLPATVAGRVYARHGSSHFCESSVNHHAPNRFLTARSVSPHSNGHIKGINRLATSHMSKFIGTPIFRKSLNR